MGKSFQTGIGDKGRLLWFLAILLVAGFAGTSLLAYRAARSGVLASIEGNALPVAAELVYARLQKDLAEPLFVSSMMANDTFMHDWILAGEQDQAAITRFLREIQIRYNTITAFFVSDRTRRYYHPTGILKMITPDDWRDEWYWRVRSMDEAYELNVDPDLANNDTLTVFINFRVIDSAGQYLGAAGVGISVAAMTSMANRLREEFGTAVYFVRPGGRIVAGLPVGYTETPGWINQVPGIGRPAELLSAAGGMAQPGNLGIDGAYRYHRGSYDVLLHVRLLEEIGWYLFVEQAEGPSVLAAKQALTVNSVVYGTILLLVLIAATFTVDRYQRRIEQAATHDPLTGVMNRLAFGAVADQAIKELQRSGKPLSALMLDADDFKSVNDQFGHPQGDAVLKVMANAIGAALRHSDIFCRWGGEEFLVLLPDCQANNALAVGDKVRSAVLDSTSRLCPVAVTISAGIAERTGNEDLDSLIYRADQALLLAKQQGKNLSILAKPA